MDILQVCAYGAENPGNFIASLQCLEEKMREKGFRTIYAFPEKARNKHWCEEIQKKTDVYFLPEAKARIHPQTYRIFHSIYRNNNITITHCHFELYDIPATITAPKYTKIFWHLHDPINVHGKRALLWKLQYGIIGKRVRLLAVSQQYKDIVVGLGFPEDQAQIVLNGISLDRITLCSNARIKEYDFLTFGWDFYRKGDDLILEACQRLWDDGYRFKLLLNGNENTWPALKDALKGKADPEFLVRGNPVEDVNEIFGKSSVFIQASRKETFSYAVCEAAYAGLPVISSDIPGLEWAHQLPSVEFFPIERADLLYECMKNHLDGGRPICKADSSRSIISEKFSLSVWANNVMNVYELKGK